MRVVVSTSVQGRKKSTYARALIDENSPVTRSAPISSFIREAGSPEYVIDLEAPDGSIVASVVTTNLDASIEELTSTPRSGERDEPELRVVERSTSTRRRR